MSFATPLWLIALPAIAALAFFDLRRRANAAQLHWPLITRLWASVSGLRPAPGDSHLPRRIALWAGLAICTFALARPRWGSSEIKIFGQAREVLIALDLSRSMTAKDVPPSRLERAKVLVSALLGALRGERVGLIVFAGTAFLQSPLSPDYEILREFLPGLDPAYLPQGGTDYDRLLQTALDAFGEGTDADRFLVVLSDGESHTESWRRHIQNLKTRNIRAITLGVGTAKGSLIPTADGGFLKDERGAAVLSKLNSSTLEELARSTGGAYRDASGWVDIATLIEATVAQGTRGDYEDQVQRLYIERFQWFLAPGVLLLLLSLWREFPSVPRIRAPRRGTTAPVEARLTAPPQISRAHRQPQAIPLLLLLPLLCLGPSIHRAAAPELPPAPADASTKLKDLLRSVPLKPGPPASDFASIARATIDAAIDPTALKDDRDARRNVIFDGIDAVDAGQRIEPKAAPWDELREQLHQLLEEHPQQQKDQQQDQNQQKDKQQQEQGSGSRQNQESENQKSENAQQKQEQQQNSPSDKQPSDGKDSPQDAQQQDGQRRDKPADPSQSLSGLTNKSEQAQQPEPKPGTTQRVGGQPTESDREAKENPELAEAFRRYERARDLDSPARLAYILDQMDGKHEEQPKKGKDW